MSLTKSVKVGVAVWLFNQRYKLLLGLRKSKHGENTWAVPGGHLEFNETIQQCAVRELQEETGIKLKQEQIRILGITNDIFSEENKHYVTIHCRADITTEIPLVKEKNKCVEWRWFDVGCLPNNLFLPIQNFFKTKQRMG